MSKPRNYLKQPYARMLMPDEGGGFYAEMVEFPGCFAQGETPEETYRNLEEAAESWIDASLSQGHQIPGPFSNAGYSGRIALRLPRSIHRRAAIMAERDRSSLNTYIVSAVAARVGAEDFYNAAAQRLEERLTTTAANLAAAFCTWTGHILEQRQTSINLDIRAIHPETSAITAQRALTGSGGGD